MLPRRKIVLLILPLTLLINGCSPIEKQAYNTVVGAKAFLDSMKSQHPECSTATSTLCVSLKRATGAKDALIDAVEVYCSSPAFLNGGPCTPPSKGTPASQQALDKLKAAITNYDQIESDVRKVVSK